MNDQRRIFSEHSRYWRDFSYVYPVISRRSKGLSIGVNLSPNSACNFDCVYCQVDRRAAGPVIGVDLRVLEDELRNLLAGAARLFEEPEFRTVAPALRRLNDIAFSGDAEPTALPAFADAVQLVAGLRREFGLTDAKIVLITNAAFLERPAVAAALAVLNENNGEIWAKLDAGTEAHFRAVNRCRMSLQHVLDNLLAAAQVRPLVIQSLFLRMHGVPPSPGEIDAYASRLNTLLEQGGRLKLVQVYTVARRPAEDFVTPLSLDELEQIAARIRPLGVPVECYG